jgi:hypothetical protein
MESFLVGGLCSHCCKQERNYTGDQWWAPDLRLRGKPSDRQAIPAVVVRSRVGRLPEQQTFARPWSRTDRFEGCKTCETGYQVP